MATFEQSLRPHSTAVLKKARSCRVVSVRRELETLREKRLNAKELAGAICLGAEEYERAL